MSICRIGKWEVDLGGGSGKLGSGGQARVGKLGVKAGFYKYFFTSIA
jgi:hypothetical protein